MGLENYRFLSVWLLAFPLPLAFKKMYTLSPNLFLDLKTTVMILERES